MFTRKLIQFAILSAITPAICHATSAEYLCQQSSISRVENIRVVSGNDGGNPIPVAISYDVVTVTARLGNVFKSMIIGQLYAGYPTVSPQSFEILESGDTYKVQPMQSGDTAFSNKDLREGTIFQGEVSVDGTFEWFFAELPIGTLPFTLNSNALDAGRIPVYCVSLMRHKSICGINPDAC